MAGGVTYISCLIASSVETNDLFIVKEFEKETIISQFVRIIKLSDQSVDSVSKNNKSCYFVKWSYRDSVSQVYRKYWTLPTNFKKCKQMFSEHLWSQLPDSFQHWHFCCTQRTIVCSIYWRKVSKTSKELFLFVIFIRGLDRGMSWILKDPGEISSLTLIIRT